MQRRFPRKKLPTLSLPALSLYTEEEIEDVPTSSSPITKKSKSKSKSTRKGDINISEVSSTSEDTNQLPSTSSKSIFMDLYEEDIWDSGPDDVTGVKDNVTTATVHKNKAKPGLSLLGEYTGSGNDTDEETLLSLGVKHKKPKETVDVSTHKNSSPECTKSEEVNLTKENSTNLETGGSEFSMEIFLADDKLSLHEDDISDIDIHALLDDSLAKGEKSKEEGQHSGFESSDCQKPSDSTTKSEKLKEAKKDKNKDSKHVGKGEKTKDKGQRSGLESSDNERLSDNKKDSKKLKEAKKDKSKKKDSKHVAKGEKSKEDGQPSGFKSSDNERLSDSRKDSKKLKEARKDKSKKKDNKSLAKDDKIKEEGQLSESESSDSERLSDSRKDSKELKEARRDKSKKKKKKKKHRKQKQVTESKEQSDGECNDDEKKIEAKQKKSRSRSKSQEISEKPKSLKRSRSRSRDRVSARRRRSRSRSSDKRKKSKYHREKSRRSRSRSSSRRRSTSKRNKHLKSYSSRSRSRNRSTSPPNKRKGRRSSISKTTPSRKKSPTSRKRKLSRSPSPHKRRGRTSEQRRSRSPKRHSRSPGKRRRTPPEKKQKSPTNKSSSKKSASPNIRERKGSLSPARKLSHRTSSASDSLDSGHFTNIPLSNTNKVADDLVFDDKVAVQKSPLMEEQKEAIIPTKSTNVEKKRSPSCSPLVKAWGDDFDFVITERLAPKEGTEKSVEDVLFGKEMADPKTPDFKRTTESIKRSSKESQNVQKKKETKDETMNGNKDIPVVCKENDVPQEVKTQQSVSSDSQSIPLNSVVKDEQSTSNSEDSKADVVSESKTAKKETVDTCKEDHAKKTKFNDNAASSHALDDSDKSAFLPPKLETIPFLDEAPPPAPPPVSGNRGHPNVPVPSQLGPSPVGKGLSPTLPSHGAPWVGLRSGASGMGVNAPKGSKGLVPTSGTAQKLYSNERDIDLTKKSKYEPFLTTKDEGRNNFDLSPMDMEMSSPEGDIIDRLHEEFWKQQKQQWNQSSGRKAVEEKPKEVFVDPMVNEQSLFEEPYEPETGLLMNEDLEEDLNSITDPKERRRKQKEKLKEKTKVQELIDKLHRQARVEEEVKHVLKVYYKHRDIDKEEYKSILRKAVPQVTNSGSSIDPERIRSLVKKYIAKIKGERFHCEDQG